MRRLGQWMVAGIAAAQLLGVAADGPRPQASRDAASATAAVPLPWAKPLKGGTLRVAAVFPRDGSSDLAALEASFDIRALLFPFSDGTNIADAVLVEALKAKCDALLVSAIPLAQLSKATRTSLAERVRGGMGLLWIAHSTSGEPDLKEFLNSAGLAPFESPPDFAARAGGGALSGLQPGLDQAFAYSSEKSRAVELCFWRPRPYGHAVVPLAPLDALEKIGRAHV